MTRLPSRPPYEPPPRTDRATARRYKVTRDEYLENNRKCAVCGARSTQVHHICRGIHRGASLTNTDLVLAACDACAPELDDQAIWSIPRQLALKLVHIIRSANAVRGRGANAVTLKDVFEFADVGET